MADGSSVRFGVFLDQIQEVRPQIITYATNNLTDVAKKSVFQAPPGGSDLIHSNNNNEYNVSYVPLRIISKR